MATSTFRTADRFLAACEAAESRAAGDAGKLAAELRTMLLQEMTSADAASMPPEGTAEYWRAEYATACDLLTKSRDMASEASAQADAWEERAEQLQAAPARPLPTKDALADIIAAGLRGTYHCTRVWSAWSYGTMGQDDFSPADESDTPAELADAILAALAAPAPVAQLLKDTYEAEKSAAAIIELVEQYGDERATQAYHGEFHCRRKPVDLLAEITRRVCAATPAAARVPLTRDRILELAEPFGAFDYGDAQGDARIAFARAIEAAGQEGGAA